MSSEALLRRIRRGDELYHVNSVVDVNNLISVESGLSVGSYDLDEVHGAITLRKAEAGEEYQGIGKDFLDMENMLVLADGDGIFGSSMSDSTRAMVTRKTRHVLVDLLLRGRSEPGGVAGAGERGISGVCRGCFRLWSGRPVGSGCLRMRILSGYPAFILSWAAFSYETSKNTQGTE